jgi:D-hydroxyproline dehydrogenase subunit gamma
MVMVEGREVRVPVGASAAVAVLAAGLPGIGTSPVNGYARPPYCMMGVCYDCLAEIDGVANQQSCMVEVREGMRIRRQTARRRLNPVA